MRVIVGDVDVYMLGVRWKVGPDGIMRPAPLAFRVPPPNYGAPDVHLGPFRTQMVVRVGDRNMRVRVDDDPGDEGHPLE